MSAAEAVPPPDRIPCDHDPESFHPDFLSSSADFVLRSCDKIKFRVHKLLLQESSLVFKSMLSLPQPIVISFIDTKSPPFIDLPEHSTVVASLLRLIYPITLPSFDDLESLQKVLFAAEKYDMRGALSRLRRYLLERQYLNTDPVHVYALARRFGWKEEAHLASRFTLVFDLYDPKYLLVFASAGLSSQDLFALFALRHKRIEGMRSFLDGDDFEGNLPGYECPGCGRVLDDVTWGFLKAAILKEMYRRPLGDGILGSDFLRTKAMSAFIAGKCNNCGKSCYDKGWTLSKIKDHLDTLPDCACDSCVE